ncbi:alpha/beta hydrolase [Arthrobacter sp. MYb224]|uniref:alpha/beta hydrolase n=1 Tax=Arthrobacter sp. MYb224 TaxID=1848600 RepID=UPI000CFE0988|nr:alpha/beta hydrolase [Arthrobacter sp. MYb224]PQZ98737.1 alpha/beta hydrolase [Arthrobacter sp. MYb224]
MAFQFRSPAAGRWEADLLGEGFTRRTLPLSDGSTATLIRHRPKSARPQFAPPLRGLAILYVHGWSDYFFQRELAQFLSTAGADFYALDLRNYGRNLTADSTPGFITDLEDYFEEFDAAHRIISSAHPGTRFVMLAHSTGGLSAALYAAAHPAKVDALALNSPWLEFQASELGRTALAKLLAVASGRNPHRNLPTIDPGFYTRTVSNRFEGEWDYDLQWRPANGFTLSTGFISAVFAAQAKVKKGLELRQPVLVMLSARDYLLPRWSDAATRSDVALNVQVVAQRSINLGRELHLVRLPDALHDVFLSAAPVRSAAYLRLGSWLATVKNRQADSSLARSVRRTVGG